MSGDRYFSGFGGSASGERSSSGNTRDEQRDVRGSHGLGEVINYKRRADQGSRERNAGLRFHELFGDGRGVRGRGRWRGRGSTKGRNNHRSPSGGYGGIHDVPRHGSSNSSYRWNRGDESSVRLGEEDWGRRGLGTGSRGPPLRAEVKAESRVGNDSDPPRSSPVLFAAARLPRPRMIDDNDENLTSRKKRKYVPGGRIGKYTKTQEYHTRSLECEVCGREFFDENAKATHDRSKEHRDAEMKNRKADEEPKIWTEPKQEDDIKQKKPGACFANQEEIAKFVKENMTKWTRAFKGWANRSIEEAKKAATAAKDRSIVTAVQREILYEFSFHTDNCTMMQEAWGRKPSATGTHYRQVEPSVCVDKVFSEEEKQKMEEERKRALQAQPAQLGQSAVVDLAEPEISAPSATLAETESQDYFVRGQPMELARPSGETLIEEVLEVRSPDATEQENYKAVQITWKMPRAASYLLSACKCPQNELVSREQRRIFPLTQELPPKGDSVEAGKALMERYNDLRSKYEAQEYEYTSWRRNLDDIMQSFKKRGTRLGSLKQCLHMQIDAAIYNQDWSGCIASCTELVKFHNSYRIWEEGDGAYVGYWIIAGLLKSGTDSNRKRTPRAGYSRLFSLVTRVRELPCGTLDDMMVDHAVQVVKSVVSNNYWQFCELNANALINKKTEDKFRYMMEDLADVVRERAIVTMTMVSGISSEGCYSNPTALSLDFVMRALKFPGETIEQRRSETRRFIEELPQGIHVDATYPESMALMGTSKRAVIQESAVVDVESLVYMSRKALAMA